MSVLMMGPRVPEIYVQGLYGNTMTNNPRGAEVATSVLETFAAQPEIRTNIREMGEYFQHRLRELMAEHPDAIEDVTGTGLLVACHLKEHFKVVGYDSVEMLCRKMGLGVIHGGKNALRYTPYFHITRDEVDLIVQITGDAINEYRKINNL
jgi:4-aminobutyrate aminotransferase-like enzyme